MAQPDDYTAALLDEMRLFRFRLAARISKNGQRATGKTQAALREYSPEPDVARLVGPFYIRALDKGVAPNPKFKKPSLSFVENIHAWLRARNLAANPWAVATNILKKGTRLWRTGRGYSGVGKDETIAGVVNSESLGTLRARLATVATRNVKSDILSNLPPSI